MAFPPSTAGANGYRRVGPEQPRSVMPDFDASRFYRRLVSPLQPSSRAFVAFGPAPPVNPLSPWPYDDFESYTLGVLLNALNGGWDWPGPYVSRSITPYDSMESYSVSAAVNGLNGGEAWPSGYVARNGLFAYDDMESYTVGNALNGLNGGQSWPSNYVARNL